MPLDLSLQVLAEFHAVNRVDILKVQLLGLKGCASQIPGQLPPSAQVRFFDSLLVYVSLMGVAEAANYRTLGKAGATRGCH